jgi:type IV secretory pathway VirB4 component
MTTNDEINFFASTTFKNQPATFGIRLEDRLRHMYILGKSGTGKSTLLENMAVDDFKKGRGVAFIDPHGDSAEVLLNYIPLRINVIYLIQR